MVIIKFHYSGKDNRMGPNGVVLLLGFFLRVDIITCTDEWPSLAPFLAKRGENEPIYDTYDSMKEKVGAMIEPKQFRHNSYNNLVAFMKSLNLKYPNITHMYSVGKW